MARSFSNTKAISQVISRTLGAGRGFASSTPQNEAVSAAARGGSQMKSKAGHETVAAGKKSVAWIPDPITGFYRPENVVEEVDAAKLRSLLLKKH